MCINELYLNLYYSVYSTYVDKFTHTHTHTPFYDIFILFICMYVCIYTFLYIVCHFSNLLLGTFSLCISTINANTVLPLCYACQNFTFQLFRFIIIR